MQQRQTLQVGKLVATYTRPFENRVGLVRILQISELFKK